MKQMFLTFILMLTFCVFSVAQVEKRDCLQIKIIAPESMMNVDEPIYFAVEPKNELEKLKSKYEWQVLNGYIVEGRETSKIRIKPESDGIKVSVTVKIIGLLNHCVNTASEFVNITPAIKDYFPDEYGKISLKDEFAILDTLIVRVANAPQYQGFIKISIDKNESVARTKKHIRQLIKYIEYRGFSKKRFVFVIRKTTFHRTVLDLIPKDLNFPNCENCEILRGEDL